MLLAALWLAATVGTSVIAYIIIGFGSGLSDLQDDGTYAGWSAGAGALGTLGLLGIWMARRTRFWLVSGIIYALFAIVTVVTLLLDG